MRILIRSRFDVLLALSSRRAPLRLFLVLIGSFFAFFQLIATLFWIIKGGFIQGFHYMFKNFILLA